MEPLVWEFVQGILTDPTRLANGLEALIENEAEVRSRRERLKETKRDKEALLAHYAVLVPENLDTLDPSSGAPSII